MNLLITDIIYLNDAAKALKQKNIIWLNNILVGMDSNDITQQYIIYTVLDTNKISCYANTPIMINQRDLSKFVKSLTTESEFVIDENKDINTLSSMTEILNIYTPKILLSKKELIVNNINKNNVLFNDIIEKDVTSDLHQLYEMNRSSGTIMYKYDENHLLTLFSGILPLAKADKLFIKIIDNPDNTFLAQFRVVKKQFNIIAYLLYLKI